jgi:protocatechuate 3,4-dioxygenase alpha subunit
MTTPLTATTATTDGPATPENFQGATFLPGGRHVPVEHLAVHTPDPEMTWEPTATPAEANTTGLTPSQTIGPFWHPALPWADGPDLVTDGDPAGVVLRGTVIDGAGVPVHDAMVEIWQADDQGGFDHEADPRGRSRRPGFRGFGRSRCDNATGEFMFRTVKPGALPDPDGGVEAPHVNVTIFARGLLQHLITRIYFPDEPSNDTDPVLSALPAERRQTLIARADGSGYRFDIHLQGPQETVFFRV